MNNEDESSGQMTDEFFTDDGDDESSTQQPQRRPIVIGDQLDIEAYVALYTGRTKISRLMFIADKCDNVSMKLEALRMAYDEIKKGESTHMFKEVVKKIDGRLGSNYGLDLSWMNAVDRRANKMQRKLDNELNAFKINLIKESIRMGHEDLGDFYYARGALAYAFNNYARARDHSTTPQHIIHACLNVILVSIEMDRFPHVINHVRKAEVKKADFDSITTAKLNCAAGLADIDSQNYKKAAHKFVKIPPELGNNYSEVIAVQDIAIYGGLCALASFDRAELKANVIENINFCKYLELVPEVRERIHDFYSSHYASCLDSLENLKTNLLLDIHLHDHVDMIHEQIRKKALIHYTHPFVSINMNSMADAFKTTLTVLEKELEALITDNQIQARIDSHNKILYARHADQRKATFQRVLETGVEFDRDIRAVLLRAKFTKRYCNFMASLKM